MFLIFIVPFFSLLCSSVERDTYQQGDDIAVLYNRYLYMSHVYIEIYVFVCVCVHMCVSIFVLSLVFYICYFTR